MLNPVIFFLFEFRTITLSISLKAKRLREKERKYDVEWKMNQIFNKLSFCHVYLDALQTNDVALFQHTNILGYIDLLNLYANKL